MAEHSELSSLPCRRVENTLRQLLNDMRTVAEARCMKHGIDGGTTANSAAALLPLIGIEIVAQRTNRGESKDQSIRRAFAELADVVGFDRYKRVGFALFKLCRNGLAHGFYPNDVQLSNGPRGGILISFWIDANTQRSVCVGDVKSSDESGHLELIRVGDRVLLQKFGQHLYVDVKAYLEDFLRRLETDSALQEIVATNDETQLRLATAGATDNLEEQDFIALGM